MKQLPAEPSAAADLYWLASPARPPSASPWRFVVRATCSSTNDLAMTQGREGTAAGLVIVSGSQSQGRGRLGRAWLSPADRGIYASVLLRPELDATDLPKLTLTAGLAVCRALGEETALPLRLKWPNDLLINGRKTGGILCESGFSAAGGGMFAVVGIGINVGTREADFPAALRAKATSLVAAGAADPHRGKLLMAILAQLGREVRRLEQGGFPDIIADWRRLDGLAGATLTWLTTGGEKITGTSLGPDESGLLRIRDRNGRIHEVLSGNLESAG